MKIVKKILVYNQKFKEENFYQSEKQKGIFNLAKDNKEALEKTEKAKKEKERLEKEINGEEENKGLQKELENKKEEKEKLFNGICGKFWTIKITYAGGDRIFDKHGFLTGLKRIQNLFNYLLNEVKYQETKKTIGEIESELKELGDKNTEKRQYLHRIENYFLNPIEKIENSEIFKEVIVGNKDNPVANLITELKNSDWIKYGLKFVDLEKRKNCPFCQEETLKKELVNNIESYFDETYDDKIKELKQIWGEYRRLTLNPEDYKRDFFTKEENLRIESLLNNFKIKQEKNLQQIKEKISSPSQEITLQSTREDIDKINDFVEEINRNIKDFNERLNDRKNVVRNLKNEFWQIQRQKYNRDIEDYNKEDKKLEKEIKQINDKIEEVRNEIKEQEDIISANLQKVTNIDETIENINKHLLDFGIQEIRIVKNEEDENTYKIERENIDDNIFKSLSEGEKTVITFLYFIEKCKGRDSKTDIKDKIIAIDDPISSLSHMYIFNVAQLIKTTFLKELKPKNEKSDYLQCFILTHNLYFMNELIGRHQQSSNKLFRLFKKESITNIKEMHHKEIQSEYQSYWTIIKDKGNRVLLANTMRNIIEYFFGFIAKENSINDIFKREEFKDNKYQSFKRYINRESHSDLSSLADYKKIDNENWQKAFKLIFEKTGYIAHYNKMMEQ